MSLLLSSGLHKGSTDAVIRQSHRRRFLDVVAIGAVHNCVQIDYL